MNRRELLGVAIAGASLAIAADTALAQEHGQGHTAHVHLEHPKLSETARNCVSAGDLCMSHCLAIFAKGDTSLAQCAKSVYQMSAVCEAIARLAAANSEQLPALARVGHATCVDCEKECRKHEKEHEICKACADSCAACAEECKKHMA